jgi:hypothetical protein
MPGGGGPSRPSETAARSSAAASAAGPGARDRRASVAVSGAAGERGRRAGHPLPPSRVPRSPHRAERAPPSRGAGGVHPLLQPRPAPPGAPVAGATPPRSHRPKADPKAAGARRPPPCVRARRLIAVCLLLPHSGLEAAPPPVVDDPDPVPQGVWHVHALRGDDQAAERLAGQDRRAGRARGGVQGDERGAASGGAEEHDRARLPGPPPPGEGRPPRRRPGARQASPSGPPVQREQTPMSECRAIFYGCGGGQFRSAGRHPVGHAIGPRSCPHAPSPRTTTSRALGL